MIFDHEFHYRGIYPLIPDGDGANPRKSKKILANIRGDSRIKKCKFIFQNYLSNPRAY